MNNANDYQKFLDMRTGIYRATYLCFLGKTERPVLFAFEVLGQGRVLIPAHNFPKDKKLEVAAGQELLLNVRKPFAHKLKGTPNAGQDLVIRHVWPTPFPQPSKTGTTDES